VLSSEQPELYVFDLDGTLVDSLADIAEALNECLVMLGLETYPVANYRYMVGEGVPKLAERAIGKRHPQLVARLAELARARYRVRPLRHTRPYVGIDAAVRELAERGAVLAVLSNKPHELTQAVTRAFWPDGLFAHVQGYIDEQHRKPEPFHFLEICEAAGVAPAAACMVGDTPTDIRTAQRAGARSIGVTWGFRTRADLAESHPDRIIDRPEALL
jgi:phosphoglycolate phosphatase